MQVRCPSCGHIHEVQARAKPGQGTQPFADGRPKFKTVFGNKLELMKIAADEKRPLTVKQFQGILYSKKISRWGRGDKRRGRASKSWTYHDVQAEVSLLVGHDLMTSTEYVETQSYETGIFEAKPTPRYFLDEVQLQKLERLKKYPGAVPALKIRHAREKGKWKE